MSENLEPKGIELSPDVVGDLGKELNDLKLNIKENIDKIYSLDNLSGVASQLQGEIESTNPSVNDEYWRRMRGNLEVNVLDKDKGLFSLRSYGIETIFRLDNYVYLDGNAQGVYFKIPSKDPKHVLKMVNFVNQSLFKGINTRNTQKAYSITDDIINFPQGHPISLSDLDSYGLQLLDPAALIVYLNNRLSDIIDLT